MPISISQKVLNVVAVACLTLTGTAVTVDVATQKQQTRKIVKEWLSDQDSLSLAEASKRVGKFKKWNRKDSLGQNVKDSLGKVIKDFSRAEVDFKPLWPDGRPLYIDSTVTLRVIVQSLDGDSTWFTGLVQSDSTGLPHLNFGIQPSTAPVINDVYRSVGK